MNKKSIIISIFILLILVGGSIYLYYNQKNNSKSNNLGSSNNYNTTKISTTNNTLSENVTKQENTTPSNTVITQPTPIESEIASYTSKIRTKDEERQNNITITCSTLNDTIVENGATFSFCDTVGQSTTSKGYEKAPVFQDGQEIEALGGGKCQVSSTLYNAVLEIGELEVVERHPHSGEVYYVPEGKDAAVSYGSYDFKFVNNTGNSIKIKASNTEDDVTIKILKLE